MSAIEYDPRQLSRGWPHEEWQSHYKGIASDERQSRMEFDAAERDRLLHPRERVMHGLPGVKLELVHLSPSTQLSPEMSQEALPKVTIAA